jgi:hypothetical protein
MAMTIQMFPTRAPKPSNFAPGRRPASATHQLLLLSVVLNVCTLVVVANLSRVLLMALQR